MMKRILDLLTKKPVKTALAMKKSLDRKAMFEYKMLEKFNLVDLDMVMQFQEDFGRCRVIAENETYWFYGFTPQTSQGMSYYEYILRQDKREKRTVFFGEAGKENFLYDGHIVQFYNDSFKDNIIFTNCESGKKIEYKWLRPTKSANGHFISYDRINRVSIQGCEVVFEVGRHKGDFHNYTLTDGKKTEYLLLVQKDAQGYSAEKIFVEETCSEADWGEKNAGSLVDAAEKQKCVEELEAWRKNLSDIEKAALEARKNLQESVSREDVEQLRMAGRITEEQAREMIDSIEALEMIANPPEAIIETTKAQIRKLEEKIKQLEE